MSVKLLILLLPFSISIYSQSDSVREDFVGNNVKEIKSRCNYSGDIVIEITESNGDGKVIAAKYIEGNIKVDKCAVEEALNHAKKLLFKPNVGAPEIQTTRIVYKIRPNKS
ncbi:hypothetical protein [Flavobacterium caeni]|uniref:hypothetical protein n=1 Tax=Flavobacterium caeni TaxID=490189 RepID=UPI00147F6A11|nr:hypothetical protein [Flavobacterium caeni]